MDEMKICSKCKTIYSKSKFYKDRTPNDGYRPSCKICTNQYYYDNRNRILNNHKSYIKENRPKKMLMKDRREKTIVILIYFVK